MYEYIKGTLIESTPSKVVLETQGIGFSLLIPFNNFSQLQALGTATTLFTSFVVREDSQRLYGFLSRHQRDLFERLIEVSGIGPKTGLALIGHMQMQDLEVAISQGHIQTICKIPGIGKKTAERLILEMRDKIKKSNPHFSDENSEQSPNSNISVAEDAISALINLGYNSAQAQKATKTALSKTEQEPELAQLITCALRHI